MKKRKLYKIFKFCAKTGFCFFAFSFAKIHSENLFNFTEYKFASNFTIPTGESDKNKNISGNTGLKFSFRDFELRGYVTLPKTEFPTISDADSVSEKFDLLNSPRYGSGIFLLKKSFPTTIKIGHNTFSKSLSKMKNPTPSAIANPLSASFSFATGFASSLPTLSSSDQPLSLAVNFLAPEKRFFLPFSFDFFINEDFNSAANISMKNALGRISRIEWAISFARFYIENDSTVLKKNYADFSPSWFYSALSEISLHSPIVKIHFYSGFQQSPYDSNSIWLKLDARTAWKIFLLDCSYFLIPTTANSPKVAPLIGASSSICRTVEQASINPQMIFMFSDKNSSQIRLGFSALENWKVTSTNTPVQLNTMKMRAAVAYESRFLNARVDWTKANVLLSGTPPTKGATPEENQSYQVNVSFVGEIFKTSFAASYTNYPPLGKSDDNSYY